MYKKLINVETAKAVGNIGLRIGVDIVYEGTKVVLFKTATGVVGTTVEHRGLKGIKKMKLDDVLGDISRKERKIERKQIRLMKKEAKIQEKLDIKEQAEKLVAEATKEVEDK